jgi:predicted dehydrogenase
LGAGNFAMHTLLPAMKAHAGTELITAAAAGGAHARHAAEKFRFHSCTTDDCQIFDDAQINTVVIATRHHLHAQQVIAALRSDKHVFCEKPLCLHAEELREIVSEYERRSDRLLLMVGFNRRFATLAIRLKNFARDIHEPLAIHYRVNAGFLPADHWLNDPQQGGGRIIGEVCHFVDFLCLLIGSRVVHVETRSLPNPGQYSNDNVECSLRFADGSLGTISYFANGDRSYSKERIEVFGGGCVAVLEDFRRLELIRHGRKRTFRSLLRRDKGHRGEWQAFADAIRTGEPSPIALDEIVNTMRAAFALEESRCLGRAIDVDSLELTRGKTSTNAAGFDRAS